MLKVGNVEQCSESQQNRKHSVLLSGFFPAMLSPGSRTHKHVTSSVSEKREHRETLYTTVDGRIPAPVDMVNIPLFPGFSTYQVVQDFFHQQ